MPRDWQRGRVSWNEEIDGEFAQRIERHRHRVRGGGAPGRNRHPCAPAEREQMRTPKAYARIAIVKRDAAAADDQGGGAEHIADDDAKTWTACRDADDLPKRLILDAAKRRIALRLPAARRRPRRDPANRVALGVRLSADQPQQTDERADRAE